VPDVVIDGGEEASGLALMFGTLLQLNVEQHPDKLADFLALNADVVIEATDLEQAITLSFRGNRCTVRDGIRGAPKVRLSADHMTLTSLSQLRIGPLGLPVYVDGAGREVLGALLHRRLRIGGMVHIGTLNRLTRLFSVM